LRHPIIVSGDDVLDYFVISLSLEREISMIKSIDNDSDVPKFSALLNDWLVTLLNLLRREIFSMIVLLFVESLLLHIH